MNYSTVTTRVSNHAPATPLNRGFFAAAGD